MRHVNLCIIGLLAMPASAVEVVVTPYAATCGLCNGAADALATGGLPPYSYNWSPAPPNGQGTPSITGLCPGDWTVEVTDGQGQTASMTVTIDDLPGLSPFLQTEVTLFACNGQCNGWATINEATIGGTPPYSYGWATIDAGLIGPGTVTFQGLCPDITPITVTDAQGCVGIIQANAGSGSEYFTTAAALPACGGASNGTIYAVGPGDGGIFRVQGSGFDSLYVLSGFPPFPLSGIPAGDYTVSPMGWAPWGGGYVDLWCTVPAWVTVPALPEPCGTLTGQIYHDADQDCTLNSFDFALPYRMFSIEPGGLFAISGSNGQFARNLINGTYTIAQGPLTNEVPYCPATGSAVFTIDNNTPTAYVPFANLSTLPHDVSVQLTSSAARPGFATQVWVTVSNNSAFPSGDVTLDLSFDPLLLDPSITGPLALGVLAPYADVVIPFTANVPADINLLGTVITYAASITNTAGEPDLTNNSTVLDVTITGSYDPNDKVGRANVSGSTTQFLLDQDAWIHYTVRFQNTGTDTAFTVVIRDEVEEDLDLLSLEILGASHPFTPSFGEARELVFTFPDILLPDSATDLAGSQGFVAFRMKPRVGLLPGDAIVNTVAIHFDFNEPVITEPSVLVAEMSTAIRGQEVGHLRIAPVPVIDRLNVSGIMPGDRLRILGADGRLLMQRASLGHVHQLDVTGLPAGAYLLLADLSDGTIARQRFIKQ